MDVRLRRQIIDLVGLRFLDDANEVGGVGDVAIVQMEANALLVGIAIEMIDARRVEGRRAPLDAVHDIALAEQQFGEIGPVLPCRAGDQRRLKAPVFHPKEPPICPRPALPTCPKWRRALACALGFLESSKRVTTWLNQNAPAPYLSAKANSTQLTVRVRKRLRGDFKD